MIIQSKRVFIENKLVPAQLLIEEGKIKKILDYGKEPVDADYGNDRILPGFYDVHTHGFEGFDTNDGTSDGLRHWLRELPKEGVCGICPTTITQSKEVLLKALQNIANVYHSEYDGAEILGIHFEGPYISKEYKGAQPEQYIVKPNVDEFIEYQNVAKGLIKIITVAPECDEDHNFIKYCSKNNVRVSIGHSSVSFDQAFQAIKNGAKSFTHTYNGMPPFHHRKKGLVEASLLSNDAYSEIICDGNHTTINALKVFFRCKKKNKTIMISDSLLAKNMPKGSKLYSGGLEIYVADDGSCHLVETNSLAGSTLRINQGLRLLVEEAGVDFAEALCSCTINPATYLGLGDHKGILKENYDADITILDDEYNVINTYCKGKKY